MNEPQRPEELRSAEAEPEVVAFVEELLRRARRGELMAVGVAVKTTDGAIVTAWELGEGETWAGLVAASAELQRRLLTECGGEE